MKKIFVSSTYIDLIPHRKSVWNLLKKINTEITGMEEFGARTSAPLETCINYAKECDIYIGIIGMRYGSIDQESGKSFTQIEYETAFENNKEILIYLFDESKGRINPGKIDFANYKKLDSFKSLLKSRHTVDSFKNEKDLVKRIDKRISQLIPRYELDFIRPRKIDGLVTRFTIANEEWMVIVGYLSGMPVELFVLEANTLPNWVCKGLIIKSQTLNHDNLTRRHDFQFEDKQGYMVTCEGMYRAYDEPIAIMNSIVSNLLIEKTDVEVIISAIHKLDLPGIKNRDVLESDIREALSKKTEDFT